MKSKLRRLVTVMTLLWIGLGYDAGAKANIVIPTPAGLAPGDTFRIAFVTSAETAATDPDINYYNDFVNKDAITEAGGGANVVTYDGTTLTFAAIASTASVSAINNIGVTGSPIFLSNGLEVAVIDDAEGLWNNGNLVNPINVDLLQQTISSSVWTGTTPYGYTEGEYALGNLLSDDGTVYSGDSLSRTSTWITNTRNKVAFPLPLYGVSQVLTVPSANPEPSSIWMAIVGFAAALTCSTARRRKHRRQRPEVQPNNSECAE
jgi:hypothetical protein